MQWIGYLSPGDPVPAGDAELSHLDARMLSIDPTAAVGEILSVLISEEAMTQLRINGANLFAVENGGPAAGIPAGTLHSMSMLTTFLLEPAIQALTFTLPSLLVRMFDPTLYQRENKVPESDIFVKLLNGYAANQQTYLQGFAADLNRLVGQAGLAQSNANVRDALHRRRARLLLLDRSQRGDWCVFSKSGGALHFHYDGAWGVEARSRAPAGRRRRRHARARKISGSAHI